MGAGFATLPDAPSFRLARARIPDGLAAAGGHDDPSDRVDITIADGRIAAIEPAGAPAPDLPVLDLDGGMAWPAFVDMHTHIDKGHILPRKANPDGTFAAALNAVAEDRMGHWSGEDVRRRMDFSLRSAWANGTALLRTHIDSLGPQHQISWPVLAETRAEWAGRIDLQAVALYPIDAILDEPWASELIGLLVRHGGLLGGATYMTPRLGEALERAVRLAMDHGLDLDFHVDETLDPAATSLRLIAETALRLRFPGRITAGHCCSLSTQPAEAAAATMALVAEAGIGIVSLPMCNLYLQDRHAGRTPRLRGITLLHELRDRAIPVAVASDNTRDPFYAYGDLDMLEVFREATRIGHFDHPFGDWPATVTRTPAAMLGRPERGVLVEGGAADLVLFRARTFDELLSRPQSDRIVIRAGHAIDRTLPDYRELDDLMAGPA